MSGETPTFKIPYASKGDLPSAPTITKASADRLETLLASIGAGQITGGAAGRLLIAQSTGAGAYKAMKGDATLAEDGTLAIGNAAVTSKKVKFVHGSVQATADLVLPSGSYGSIPGLNFKVAPEVKSILRVDGSFNMSCEVGQANGTSHSLATIRIGTGAVASEHATVATAGIVGNMRCTAHMSWELTLEPGEYEINGRGTCSLTGAGSPGAIYAFGFGASTKLSYFMFAA